MDFKAPTPPPTHTPWQHYRVPAFDQDIFLAPPCQGEENAIFSLSVPSNVANSGANLTWPRMREISVLTVIIFEAGMKTSMLQLQLQPQSPLVLAPTPLSNCQLGPTSTPGPSNTTATSTSLSLAKQDAKVGYRPTKKESKDLVEIGKLIFIPDAALRQCQDFVLNISALCRMSPDSFRFHLLIPSPLLFRFHFYSRTPPERPRVIRQLSRALHPTPSTHDGRLLHRRCHVTTATFAIIAIDHNRPPCLAVFTRVAPSSDLPGSRILSPTSSQARPSTPLAHPPSPPTTSPANPPTSLSTATRSSAPSSATPVPAQASGTSSTKIAHALVAPPSPLPPLPPQRTSSLNVDAASALSTTSPITTFNTSLKAISSNAFTPSTTPARKTSPSSPPSPASTTKTLFPRTPTTPLRGLPSAAPSDV
ncbi:hypothetical protein BOTBODRAFT_179986 [Botryobasidium botryosum FD-172 SS1]|uniref:Uncharacterized protein n=1 Tax=Botryobasidium botryosum (strain FD-172 SS1) TaxID=930990 RepID=A0A067M120_BOTB1|nr:hypothetical protein BOTBODRAFT_179986 [Botryobasidium botryosum FD-172 SS1]